MMKQEYSMKEKMRLSSELDSLIESYGWEYLYEQETNSSFLIKLSKKIYLSEPLNGETWKLFLDEKREYYPESDLKEETKKQSFWEIYRESLRKKGISEEDIENNECAADKVLSHLKLKTENSSTRGLMIGNVQSGKTANIGAVISKAADEGFNFFIILTGTIEKLRGQSQKRLIRDLNDNHWTGLEHLKGKMSEQNQLLSGLDLTDDNKYLSFTLKQRSRLQGLLDWIQSDPDKAKQLKVLVIDDEADQASQNTEDVTSEEQTTIHRLITELVNGNEDHALLTDAMNYVAYTATPYANLLNDASSKSLYPKDYIYTLKDSRNYIGPEQIFGYNSSSNESEGKGLNIIRPINAVFNAKVDQPLFDHGLPKSLQNSFLWFICGVAVMRSFGYKKPISMLIHIDLKIIKQEEVLDELLNWLNSTSLKSKMSLARDIYDYETSKFTINDFKKAIPDYGNLDKIKDYPKFKDIENEVRFLLRKAPQFIQMEDKQPVYQDGIHICVDNSSRTYEEDGSYRRLLYPEEDQMPDKAPAFVVIGGSTLSRGLTLEGLISTYFARNTSMADSLTQMGRWFGYRKDYELIPRIWMTDKAYERFTLASEIDHELRKEIEYMELQGLKPSMYGPKIKTSPNAQLLRVTAKNKMQSAAEVKLNYHGQTYSTYRFDNSIEAINKNWNLLDNFIEQLNEPDPHHAVSTNYVWRNVGLSEIEGFLKEYQFEDNQIFARSLPALLEWLQQEKKKGKYGQWNVILAGINGLDTDKVKVGELEIVPGHRSGKVTIDEGVYPASVQVQNLLVPYDLISDIDTSSAGSSLKEKIKSFSISPNPTGAARLREEAGIENIPQLILYPIQGGPSSKNLDKNGLHARNNLVGIYLQIPDNSEEEEGTYLHIPMQEFLTEGEISQ